MLGSVYISKRLTDEMNKNDIIPSKYAAHYQFCFEYIYENIIFTSSIIAVCIIIKELAAGLVFLSIIIPMRSFCGGIHAASKNKCTVLSYLLVAIYLILFHIMEYFPAIPTLMSLMFIFCIMTLIILSPADTPAKRFTVPQKEKMHMLSCIYGILIMIVYLILYYCSHIIMCNAIFLSTASVWISVVLAAIRNSLYIRKESLL